MISVKTTQSVAARNRVAYWNSVVTDAFTSLQVAPIHRQDFHAHLKRTQLQNISIAEVFANGSRVAHTKEQIGRETEPFFLVHLQVDGCSINRQCGREAILHPGDLTLCDTTRPYTVDFEVDNTMLVMRVPAQRLNSLLGSPENLTCLPVTSTSSGGFTAGVLTHIWHELATNPHDDQQRQTLERMVLDSLSMGFQQHAGNSVCASSVKRSKRVRVLSFIEANLNDANLSPQFVANAFAISTRYLHQLFNEQNESVSQYILRRRLELATELLVRTKHNGQTISQVAFSLGFNSLSHFGRVFREKYNLTPKEFIIGASN